MNRLLDPRAWVMSRYLIGAHGVLAMVVWVPFVVVVTGIAFIIDRYGTLDASVWEGAAQVPRWYALAIMIHVVTTHLPLHIAHGGTRREFSTQLGVFTWGFSGILAGLVTLGFVIESAVYGVMDWPHEVPGYALFDSPTQLGWSFVTFLLVFLVWTTAVGFVTAAFYRSPGWGSLAILPGFAMVGTAESVVGSEALPFITNVVEFGRGSPTVVTTVLWCLAFTAVALFLTRAVVRDIPVRNRAT